MMEKAVMNTDLSRKLANAGLLRRYAIGALLLIAPSFASAEIAVIVNLNNKDKITMDDVQKTYLAKTKTFPGGGKIVALDQAEGSTSRVEFVSKVVKKDEAQMKAYWSRLIFTGKGVPPKTLDSDAAVLEAVISNPNAIGFVEADSVTDKVRVIGTL
ncbi:Conserved hypothetical protein [gamma proteobacterium HdN1]|nr:Conserved hypothetical protein [gamma proteobacterium HdN1]